MEIKKQYILETASNLFLERGYPKTSMQDVAEECNVSKATLYKFFNSKESLGILVLFYLTEQMLEKVERIREDKRPDPIEVLRKSILVRMDRFAERNRFMDELLFSLSAEQRENYLSLVNKSRFNIFQLFTRVIMRAFQIENEVAASELTLNLNGLIREISFIGGQDIIELDKSSTADFIIDSLRAIMKERAGKKSLMTQEQLQALKMVFCNEEKLLRPILKKKRLMHSIRGVLEDYEKSGRSCCLQEAEKLIEDLKNLEESEEI